MGLFGDRKDEPRPDFSNVKGGGSTTAPPAGDESADTARMYEVVKGDSLWKIAEREYGDGSKWRLIYEANRDSIEDPDRIHPGQKLTIPEV